jgi:hypothetical protein
MRNLGPRCEEMLAAIGIDCENELRRFGAANAYRELVNAGLTRPHRMFSYALGGAVADLDCLRLPADLKRELEAEAAGFEDEGVGAVAEAGFYAQGLVGGEVRVVAAAPY